MGWYCRNPIFFMTIVSLRFLQNIQIPDLTQLFPDIHIPNNVDCRISFQQDGAHTGKKKIRVQK